MKTGCAGIEAGNGSTLLLVHAEGDGADGEGVGIGVDDMHLHLVLVAEIGEHFRPAGVKVGGWIRDGLGAGGGGVEHGAAFGAEEA